MITKILEVFKSMDSGILEDSDLVSDKYLSTKKWEWSYLRVSDSYFCLKKISHHD